MRTTVNIPDALLEQAKARSLEEGKSLGELVADGLRVLLSRGPEGSDVRPEPLPTFGQGGVQGGVDLDHNAALLELMEGR
ncbi:antitoxin [Haloferula helveola]|uniref:Antitoxin n=1 Tax=Haloferula helveola TaxID=490095 RepID=A0ABN6H1A8_9BACT|nr:antitoxin [Haloferula helveola]